MALAASQGFGILPQRQRFLAKRANQNFQKLPGNHAGILTRKLPGAKLERRAHAHAGCNVSRVISGGTPIRTGMPNVPSPRLT